MERMKKITLEQLIRQSGEESYPEQYRYICGLIQSNRLIPVKASSLNGKKPALHQSYWVVEEAPDYREEIEELKFRMAPEIRTDYYLRHPQVYREEVLWVRRLNRYFLERAENREKAVEPTFISLNERSFQIWGREKFLQREQGRTVLDHCGVTIDQLHVYGTTEPLPYYSRIRRVPQTILILENKDTFYSMRRFLSAEGERDGRCLDTGSGEQSEYGKTISGQGEGPLAEPGRIFGVEIGTVIYGAGKGILRSFEDFCSCVEPHVNDAGNEILYFGDLDYEGIGIYEHLACLFGGEQGGKHPSGVQHLGIRHLGAQHLGIQVHEIKPFVQAYEKMLEKARHYGMDFLPETSERQNRSLSGLFFRYFPEGTQRQMERLLEAGKYIPQEIINRMDF